MDDGGVFCGFPGEANIDHPENYACLFPAMIQDWRQKFNVESMGQTPSDFPFGFVQVSTLTFTLLHVTEIFWLEKNIYA